MPFYLVTNFVHSGLLSLLLITVYNIVYDEIPLLNRLTNLTVAVGGSCIWVFVNSVRAEIADGYIGDHGGTDVVDICQEVDI